MLPDTGTVIVLVAGLTDCPIASVYGPVTTAAESKATPIGTVTVLASNETAPFCAKARPSSMAPLSSVIEV
jgi:hypothetical protein